MSLVNRILLVSESLSTTAAGLIGPIYAIYVEGIGGGILEAANAYAAFMITMGLVIFILGRWEDHHRHDRIFIIAGYFVTALGFAGYIFVSNPVQLLIVQVILGFGMAVRTPAYDSLYSRTVVHKHFALAWGDWEAADSFATGIAAFVGGVVASLYGFKTLLVLMFLISLFSLAISLTLYSKEVKLGSQ